jgi:hypothetical protein
LRFLPAIPPTDSTEFKDWIRTGTADYHSLYATYHQHRATIVQELEQIDHRLLNDPTITCEKGYRILHEKILLEKNLQNLDEEMELKALRIRFQKSIEILKMLYEKILSMDHHFSSLKAHQQVLRISNPHEYPDFKEAKTVLEERMKRKFGFALPPLMESNPYLSAVFSIVGLTLGSESRMNREQLDRIGCILDFTVRMHNDFNVIYFEAGYLRDANRSLKQACETLFADCTRQLDYSVPLSTCRDLDDWERLYTLVDDYAGKNEHNTGDPIAKQRTRTNLLFAIDRVVRFIDHYDAFVSQGNEYYKKFDKIAGSYANEQACSESLPEQFRQIKTDIQTTLEKFNNAYKIPEIQGSRLKDLLYGHVE